MIDVARLLRHGDLETAIEVRDVADELAEHRSARAVAEVASRPAMTASEALDEASGGALTRLALLTEGRRRSLGDRLRIRRSTGIVVERSDGWAIVSTEEGRRLGVSEKTGSDPSLLAVGALVYVESEHVDSRLSLVWVRPAIQAADDRHGRLPGAPHLLTDEERRRIDTEVLVVG